MLEDTRVIETWVAKPDTDHRVYIAREDDEGLEICICDQTDGIGIAKELAVHLGGNFLGASDDGDRPKR